MKPRTDVSETSERCAIQGALVFVLLLLRPFAALAENGGEIHNYIISINRLYESLDYEFALNQIQLGRQLPRSTEQEVTLTLYEGIILCEMGKPSTGTSAFRAALLLRPNAKLPVQVAPKVVALFESVRKQVKKEVGSIPALSGTEKPSNKTEQKRENPPSPPSTGPAQENRKDTKTAQSPRKDEPSNAAPRDSATQGANADMKLPPMPPAPITQKAEQKKEDPRREAERLETEAKQLEAKRQEAERQRETKRALLKHQLRDAANLDTSKCQPVVSTDCERELLKQRINTVYKIFLSTKPPSPHSPVKELLSLLNRAQVARTHEDLQRVSQAIDTWQQRQFPY